PAPEMNPQVAQLPARHHVYVRLPAPDARFLPPSAPDGLSRCHAALRAKSHQDLPAMRPAIPMRTAYNANRFPAAGTNIAGWNRDIPQDLPTSEYAHQHVD